MSNLFFVFCLSFLSLFIFRKIAKKVGLVDQPNERKNHVGQIPLIGGVSIFTTLVIAFITVYPLSELLIKYLTCSFVLVCLGVLDDKFDLSFKIRLAVQIGISLFMIFICHKSLHYLGFMFTNAPLYLPLSISLIITTLAVVGAINAFNMVDGIDGLLGGLSSVTLIALGTMFYLTQRPDLALFCTLLIVAIFPYILLNLGFPFGIRFKVFMGDAGSMLIGFTVIWLLIESSQDEFVQTIRPVTALWFIGVPLIDMVSIMIRRIKKGQSPFKPDREHLHHICQRLGMSQGFSLFFICAIASLMAGFGIWAELNQVNDKLMFILFLLVFVVYFYVINHIWRITIFLHKHLKFTLPSHE